MVAPLVPAHVSSPARSLSGPRLAAELGATAAIALAFGAGLGGGALLTAASVPPPDPCALPGGVELGALTSADRSWIAHRAVACSDREHGRITAAEYRAAIASNDATPIAIAVEPPPRPAIVWAATVRSVSSQWSDTDWSAARVLGAPDAAPGSDDPNAWASLGADDRVEWIEVGLAQPRRLSAVQVFESYNPGAVSRVELITTSGAHVVAFAGGPMRMGETANMRMFELACTDEPIAAIHVTVDSMAVSGWNELDAIGGVPCD